MLNKYNKNKGINGYQRTNHYYINIKKLDIIKKENLFLTNICEQNEKKSFLKKNNIYLDNLISCKNYTNKFLQKMLNLKEQKAYNKLLKVKRNSNSISNLFITNSNYMQFKKPELNFCFKSNIQNKFSKKNTEFGNVNIRYSCFNKQLSNKIKLSKPTKFSLIYDSKIKDYFKSTISNIKNLNSLLY